MLVFCFFTSNCSIFVHLIQILLFYLLILNCYSLFIHLIQNNVVLRVSFNEMCLNLGHSIKNIVVFHLMNCGLISIQVNQHIIFFDLTNHASISIQVIQNNELFLLTKATGHHVNRRWACNCYVFPFPSISFL